MVARPAPARSLTTDAVEFVRFCYARRRVGWPELYDEMCAVAGRGLFRGYGADDLAAFGIGFSLYNMPALAVLASRVVCEEQALRRPSRITLSDAEAPIANTEDRPAAHDVRAISGQPARDRERLSGDRTHQAPLRLAVAT